MPLGIYCHIPFCATACDFCAFYQEAPRRQDLDRYLAGMEQEFATAPAPLDAATVFWGGGTPGLLPARDLAALGEGLLTILARSPAEWSVEIAPSTVKPDKIRALRDLGVNRISMGVQSFDPGLLNDLGRQHSPKQVYQAIDTLRAEGIENLNLDLIFSIPGQTLDSWEKDLREAIAVGPEHISTYCLTFEEDTRLYARMLRGEVKPHSEEEDAGFFYRSWDILGEAGYAQYEISNYARPGHACQHNLDTWAMAEWLGFGPSAASQFSGRRWANVPSIDTWLAGLENPTPALADETALTPAILAADALVFGLRMNAGIDLAEIRRRFPDASLAALDPHWQHLTEDGLLETSGTTIRLTREGRLVADAIGVSVMEKLE